jgi:hypothetical protein
MAQLDSATYARFLEKSISKSRVPISHASFKWQIAAIDISAVVASCFAGGFAYHLIAVPNFIPDVGILAGTGILAATFYVLVARAFGLYDFQFSVPARFRSVHDARIGWLGFIRAAAFPGSLSA